VRIWLLLVVLSLAGLGCSGAGGDEASESRERFARDFADLGAPEGDRVRVRQFLLTLAEGSQLAREIITVLDWGQQPS
jgi:hypothetical protein